MKPLVSILIPAFNAERWIEDTIRSALDQSWREKEIIIVDDGSTDGTFTVAKKFASSNVSVTHQNNRGASAARNKALALAQGQYIQWLDADDLLAPDKIAKQLEALELRPGEGTLLSSSWARFLYRTRKAQFNPSSLWCDLDPVEWMVRKMSENLQMQPATWLVSREMTQAAGPWDERLSLDDDGEYFCRVLLASRGTRFVPEARVFYRQGVDSLSCVGVSSKKLESQMLAMRLQIRYLLAVEDSERTRSACLKYLQTWVMYFHPERKDLVEEMATLARQLGGTLKISELSWKYGWIEALFGRSCAKRIQTSCRRWKTSLSRSLDKALLNMEQRIAER